MELHSDNPQIVYSMTVLSKTLFELMKEKPFEEITVTQLCSEAQVARKTFYRNCQSKTDLIDYMIEKLADELHAGVDYGSEDYETMYRHFFAFWEKHRAFLQVLHVQGLFPRFCSVFTQYCVRGSSYRFLETFLNQKGNAGSLRLYHHAFLIGGLCHVLQQWTQEGVVTPIEDLVSVMGYLVPRH